MYDTLALSFAFMDGCEFPLDDASIAGPKPYVDLWHLMEELSDLEISAITIYWNSSILPIEVRRKFEGKIPMQNVTENSGARSQIARLEQPPSSFSAGASRRREIVGP